MAKPVTITAHPSWNAAQTRAFDNIAGAIPVMMGYVGSEIPLLDNHSDKQIVDETGVLKAVKKVFEKAEKAHVERLKARIGDKDGMMGTLYEAKYKGSKRVILNQEACKEIIAQCDAEGIHLKRLLAAIKSGQVEIPQNVWLADPTNPGELPETNTDDFYTTAAGGRSLYVEAL